METIRAINTLESGGVIRYHSAPSVKPQTLSDHQWSCYIIATQVWGGVLPAHFALEVLTHDAGELYTGDVPFTVKRDNLEIRNFIERLDAAACKRELICPDRTELHPEERAVLKLADTLDGLRWTCRHESLSGNLIWTRWCRSYDLARTRFRDLVGSERIRRADALAQQWGWSETSEAQP